MNINCPLCNKKLMYRETTLSYYCNTALDHTITVINTYENGNYEVSIWIYAKSEEIMANYYNTLGSDYTNILVDNLDEVVSFLQCFANCSYLA